MFEPRHKTLVGLDIGSTSVKVVQLGGPAELPRVERFAVVEIDPEGDPETAVISAVKEAVGQAELTTNMVATSVAGPLLAVRQFEFPKLSDEELRGAIYWEGSQVIPFSIEDVYTDFQVFPVKRDGPEEETAILFVAASKQLIDDRFKLVQKCGLEPRVIDIDALAILNCFRQGRESEDISGEVEENKPHTALLNIGARFSSLVVINGNCVPFTRDIVIAGNNFTEAIQKATGVSPKEAEALKRRPDNISAAENIAIMESTFSRLSNEVRHSFDYFLSKEGGSRIDRILLGGGGSETLGLKDFISEDLGIPVEQINPLGNMFADPDKVDNEKLTKFAPLLTVAIGLALRRDPK